MTDCDDKFERTLRNWKKHCYLTFTRMSIHSTQAKENRVVRQGVLTRVHTSGKWVCTHGGDMLVEKYHCGTYICPSICTFISTPMRLTLNFLSLHDISSYFYTFNELSLVYIHIPYVDPDESTSESYPGRNTRTSILVAYCVNTSFNKHTLVTSEVTCFVKSVEITLEQVSYHVD